MMASARARFSTAELANLLMQTHHGSLLQSKYKEDTVLVIVADMWPELPDELNHTSKITPEAPVLLLVITTN